MENKTNATLIEMVEKANAVDNANYTEIPTDIIAKATEDNKNAFNNECYRLATMEKNAFFNAFFNANAQKGLTDKNEIEKAILSAVSVPQKELTINDNGLIEISSGYKTITFNDVFKARQEFYSKGHTDKTPKKDKNNAIKFFFGDLGMGYCAMLTESAYIHEIKSEPKTPNANYTKTANAVNEICEKAKKQNPFTKKSNSGYCEQISMVLEYFMTENVAKVTYHHYERMVKIICNVNKRGKLTIADENGVMNALAIVYRYAFNGYKLPTNDKSTIYKVIENK